MAETNTTAEADDAKAPETTKTEVDNIPVDTTSAVDASAKPAPAPEPASTETTPTEGEGADKTKPQRLPKWAEDKLAETAFEAREATRRLKEAEEKLAAMAKPASETLKPNAEDDAAAKANAPQGGYKTQAEFDAAVKAEATKREAQAREAEAQAKFDAACNAAYEKGKGTFKDDFDVAVDNLRNVGAMSRDVLDLVLETADPAKVLYELGRDPDKAKSLIGMTPAKRAIEIAAMSQPATKKPVALSKAPTPVPSLDGGARVTAVPTDDDDDETFFAKREAELTASGRW